MTPQILDSGFGDGIRAELTAIGTRGSRLERHQRRVRLAAAALVAGGLVAATTGATLVAGGFPGSTTVTPAGQEVTVERTGTAEIQLGRPEGANTVILDVTCLSDRGTISVPTNDGWSQNRDATVEPSPTFVSWDCADVSRPIHIAEGELVEGASSITVTADPGTRWKAVARYGQATTSDWAVNENGQTYGTPNAKNGSPDLISVQTADGKTGWARSSDVARFHGCGDSIPVYETDGTTVIGEFVFGDPASDGCATAAPEPTG